MLFFLFAFLKLEDQKKVNLLLMVFGIAIPLYIIEFVLLINVEPHPSTIQYRALKAQKLGKPFDTRTKFQVIMDFRKEGIEAYPNSPPSEVNHKERLDKFEPSLRHDGLYFLGNMSNTFIVDCNEGGEFLTYVSDEHGFPNSKGLYKKNMLDVVAIGDSHTSGNCVKVEANSISYIKQHYKNTLNLGTGGSGPLANLAKIREYIEPLKPKIVLWMHQSSDLIDLGYEKKFSILMQYLDPDFSQNLMQRQPELDRMLKEIVFKAEKQTASEEGEYEKWRKTLTLKGFLVLRQIRGKIFLLNQDNENKRTDNRKLLVKLLTLANKTVTAWGGKLYFVFIPSAEFHYPGYLSPTHRSQVIIPLVESLNIPVIDIYTPLSKHPDILSLYALRGKSHLNEKGYKFMGELLLKGIQEDLSE